MVEIVDEWSELPAQDGLAAELAELSVGAGVATEFWDWRGEHVSVPRTTILAVLTALGMDVSTPSRARATLAERHLATWRHRLPDVVVVRQPEGGEVRVHVPEGWPGAVSVHTEDGQVLALDPLAHRGVTRRVDDIPMMEVAFGIPAGLPLGWHSLHACTNQGGDPAANPDAGRPDATCPLVVCPAALPLPDGLAQRSAWGFMIQLYATRSRRSWGLGDLGDLAELASWSARQLGAGFVLVNPLHAGEPTPPLEPSPYLPTSRRFGHAIYLRVEQIPEAAYLSLADHHRLVELAASARPPAGPAELIDRDAVWAAKRPALELVRALGLSPARRAQYEDFQRQQGEDLETYATWAALAEQHGSDWRTWPVELRDPRSAAVAQAREGLADQVSFHRWCQWVLDEQLAQAQQAARSAGMGVGVVADLAVGVSRGGADTWAYGPLYAGQVSVGAPPDAFNQQGQDWSQPPWRPDLLAQVGYVPFRDTVRAALRHAGGLRLDHVLGLFRLWWIPQGQGPAAGTYVRYDHDALLGILALEAHRVGALVIGEDLGTVEPWVRDVLAERGLLGTSILWFERDGSGRPRPPERWRRLALASVTTHDLPPTAGYLRGEHVRLRARLGLLTRPEAQELAADRADQAAWMDLLNDGQLRRPDDLPVEPEATVLALHRLLARTPSVLHGVSLADAAGDRRTINQPGTIDAYPNWRRPLADPGGQPVFLEDLEAASWSRRLAATMADPDPGNDGPAG
ncbi:MAG: 4-alpha-glucanotransferase [Actinomycetes bacterium]